MNQQPGKAPRGPSCESTVDPRLCPETSPGPATLNGTHRVFLVEESSVHVFDQIGPLSEMPRWTPLDDANTNANASLNANDETEQVNTFLTVEFTDLLHDTFPLQDDASDLPKEAEKAQEDGGLPPLVSVSSPSSSSSSVPSCPATVAVIHSIQGHHSNKPLSALVDTGSTYTHISASSLAKGVTPLRLPRPVRGSTLAGTIESYGYVQLKDITLPERDPSCRIESLRAYVFKSPCKYNVILGTDFCATAGLIIDCAVPNRRFDGSTTRYCSSQLRTTQALLLLSRTTRLLQSILIISTPTLCANRSSKASMKEPTPKTSPTSRPT
jgi:hypothetical protein